MVSVEIDGNSGFCPGVIRVIGKAEEFLEHNDHLYSLGAIVHNEEELARLEAKGLVTIDDDDLDQIQSADGENLLVRAHGEPPEFFTHAARLGFNVIDCTCPVVLKLQHDIADAHARLASSGGQLIIFGMIGHAEVLGLVGRAEGEALVVESLAQLERNIKDGLVRTEGAIEIFSQTTMSPERYRELCARLREVMADPGRLTVHNTICLQVSSRHRQLAEFAMMHDVIVFVSGRSSSNGKVLCDLCRSYNIRTFHISAPSELQSAWFAGNDRVGVCGATSTPKWLLEDVADAIENLQ